MGQQIHKTEVGNVLVISKEFLTAYTDQVTELATQKAIEQYRKEKSKDEKMTVSQIARQERCSSTTVLNWINKGIRKGKIKLKASKKGEKNYLVSRYDLNAFLKLKASG